MLAPSRSEPALLEDLDTLCPSRDFSRRDFVRPSIGSGLAAAWLPVMAHTLIRTDRSGLLAGEAMIGVDGLSLPADRAAPLNRAGAPMVLVVSVGLGVRE